MEEKESRGHRQQSGRREKADLASCRNEIVASRRRTKHVERVIATTIVSANIG